MRSPLFGLLLVAAATLSLPAHAATNSVISKFHPDQVVLPSGGWGIRPGTSVPATTAPARTWEPVQQGASKLTATESVTLTAPGGSLLVKVAQDVSLADVALTVAACAATGGVAGGGVCAAVEAAKIALSAYRIYTADKRPDLALPGGKLAIDPGQEPLTKRMTVYRTSGDQYTDASSPDASCKIYMQRHYPGWQAFMTYDAGPYIDCAMRQAAPVTPQNSNADAAIQTVVTDGGKTCPGVIDASNPAFSIPEGAPPGPDGLCATARYTAQSPAAVAGIITALPAAMQGPALSALAPPFQSSIDAGSSTAPSSLTTSGPVSQTGTPTTSRTVNADGSVVTKTDTPTYTYNYAGDTIDARETHAITVQTCTGAGACSTSTTTTSAPAPVAPIPVTTTPAPEEIKVCGLPSTPPCKIDESGTPTTADDPTQKIVDAAVDQKKLAADPTSFFPKMPALAWNFALPSGCGVIPLPGYAEFLPDGIDVCRFKPVFDDLMSIVWLFGGIFGAIQLFLRDSLAAA